jgi:hypothetical protein
MRSIPLRKAPDLEPEELAGEQAAALTVPAERLVNLCARVPRELRSRLKARALAEDRSVQELVVEVVARYLDEG